MPGGRWPVTNEKDLSALKDRLKSYLEELSKRGELTLELVRINRAYAQVVAGMFYIMSVSLNENGRQAECSIEMWEQSWKNFVKMNVKCGKNLYEFKKWSVRFKERSKWQLNDDTNIETETFAPNRLSIIAENKELLLLQVANKWKSDDYIRCLHE